MEPSQYQHNIQEPTNHLIAETSLGSGSEQANRLLLLEQSLQVYYKGKGRAFSLAYVQRLALEHRKLWLPLIGGGILASLCLLALLHTFTMPYRLLTGMALGLLGLWWGYRGTMALVVYEQRHHQDFLISSPADSLPVFLAFANRIIRKYPQPLGPYCISLKLEEWQQLQESSQLQLASARLSIPREVALHQSAGSGCAWAVFDPYSMGQRLQWSLQGSELQAHVQGTLHRQELRVLR